MGHEPRGFIAHWKCRFKGKKFLGDFSTLITSRGQVLTKKTKIETNEPCPFEIRFLRSKNVPKKERKRRDGAYVYSSDRRKSVIFSKGQGSLVSFLVFLAGTWLLLVIIVEKHPRNLFPFNLQIQTGVFYIFYITTRIYSRLRRSARLARNTQHKKFWKTKNRNLFFAKLKTFFCKIFFRVFDITNKCP